MIIWLNAQLPPAIAAWITGTFGITTIAVRALGLRDAKEALPVSIKGIVTGATVFLPIICYLWS